MTETTEPETPSLDIKEEPETRLPDAEVSKHENLVKYENRDIEPASSDDSFGNMSRTELIELCKNSNTYISNLESKLANCEAEILTLKNAADYQKQRDPSYREKVLLRKLSLKEQEIQDYAAQINELKAAQIPSLVTLKSTLLDPAINIIVQKLKNELSCTKASLEETQNELNAWKFTPDSNTGKRLMAKCRLLHQENEELGKMISSGRVAKLEGELALQKSFSEEVKKSQFELDELLQDLDEDVEGMQGTIYYLQQELKKSKEKVIDLETKNQELRNTVDRSANQTADAEDSADGKLPVNLGKASNLRLVAATEDDSSNDSCLILKVNPEEEYATMLSMNDRTIKTEENETDFKSKRTNDDSFKNVPPKKQKRLNVSQDTSEKSDEKE